MPTWAPDASSGQPSKAMLPAYPASNEALAEKMLYRVGFSLGFLAKKGASVQLKLIVRTVEDIVIVDCSGRIIFGEESADLRDTVKMVITQSKRVILNLQGVTYIDSGGLGTLVALYTTARNNGGSIKLANLTQRVGDLLQVTKLVTIFDVHDSEEKAIESYRKGAAA
jgi:anti-sigma B factor antagonist